MKVLLYFSITLLILSGFIHLITFFGVDIAGYFPFVWLLHVGIFAIVIPSVFMKPFVDNPRTPTGWHNLLLPVPKKHRQLLLKWYPASLVVNLIVTVFLYQLINRFFSPSQESLSQAFSLHIFSALWIYAFLFLSITLWYHQLRQDKINHKKH